MPIHEPSTLARSVTGFLFAFFVISGVAVGWGLGTLIGQIGIGVAFGVAFGISVAVVIDGLIVLRRLRRKQP